VSIQFIESDMEEMGGEGNPHLLNDTWILDGKSFVL
jgi:hypothetical protein